jgi:LmbE family N-acetylglucosaminyl deacetylase
MPSSRVRAETVPLRNSKAAVVVAHPDDEALWLSSAVASAGRIVLCFGARIDRPRVSDARQRAVAALPLAGIVDLAIPESGAGFSAALEPGSAEVRIEQPDARTRYESNSAKLIEQLRSALAGFQEVYTHNPWGEYGHPEHIQVHRAVTALQGELGYTIWFSNYVSAASWRLALRLAEDVRCAERRVVQPDRLTARTLMRVYRQHGAWTWTRAHRWPHEEVFFSQPPPGDPAPRRPLCGEWLLDLTRLRWWSPPWLSSHRRLPLLRRAGGDGDVHTPPLAR